MYEPWMCVVTYVPPWACDARIACVCVCACQNVWEWGIAERNEGHPEDLDSCMCRRLMETYQYWGFICRFFFFSFFGSSCMYEEYLHSLTRTITNGQNAGQAQPHPPCLCVTRHTSWLHFPVNTNLSICCFGEGSISFSVVSVMMGTWGLVWNSIIGFDGCLVSKFPFSLCVCFWTLIISRFGQLPLHFLAVL